MTVKKKSPVKKKPPVKKKAAKRKAVKRNVAPKKKVVKKKATTKEESLSEIVARVKKRRLGRPSPYKTEYGHIAKVLCQQGATDEVLAEAFKVSKRTIHAWKKKHPDDFLHPVKMGKEVADDIIRSSLFHRAKGYSHVDTKFASFEGVITDSEEYTKHYPPDTGACIFWLSNRDPDNWKRNGADGGGDDTDIAAAIMKLMSVIPV